MLLKPVRLNKKDTCLSYALKRVGITSKIEFAKNIPKSMLSPFKVELAEVGKIVVWESEKTHYLYNSEIRTIQNRPAIIANNEYVGRHFGVIEAVDKVEGEIVITVSDCVRNENGHSFPTIGLCTLTDNEKARSTEAKMPTYYLNKKHMENG